MSLCCDNQIVKTIYKVFRGVKVDQNGYNYSGAFCTNSFKTDGLISLDKLIIFGPATEAQAKYFTYLEIYESKYAIVDDRGIKIFKIKTNMIGRKDDYMFIDCNNVQARPGYWYHVQFMLDGPNTAKLEGTVSTVEVALDNGKTINFQWLVGSRQMPALQFTE